VIKKWREWVLNKEDSFKVIEAAWKAGINFFDTADMYSNGVSEEILGYAIKTLGIPRDEIVIATKCFAEMKKKEPLNDGKKPITNSIKVNNQGLNRKHIFEACEASLKRLNTDYIDLYQIHRWDSTTPIEETMKALHDLVQMGKVRYIGASTMFAWQFAKAQEVALKNGWTTFTSMQNLYNLVYREEERDMIPLCYSQGVGLIPWSPLARGYLTRTNDPATNKATVREQVEDQLTVGWFDEHTAKIRDVLHKIAKEKKVSAATLATAWVLHQAPVSSAIVGISKASQLDDAIAAINVKLTDKELDELEVHYRPRDLQGMWPKPKLSIRAKL